MKNVIKTGYIGSKNSVEIDSSRIGIGFEKLDRALFDPENAYDKVAATGVKWIRIQSGWARCEKEKGKYDFSWLDEIVDNLVARGLVPWMCLCYGNKIYNKEAEKVFGAVGCPPIFNDEQINGWLNYVKATAEHFKDRVTYYEIWNEPDCIHSWKHGPSGEEYGRFAAQTAKAVKSADNSLKVIGGALGGDFEYRNMSFITDAMKSGMADCIDAITFHEYTNDESTTVERIKSLEALIKRFNPNIRLIQGETGAQSRCGGNGALKTGFWNESRQAKILAKQTICCLGSNVLFSSYFSCIDMAEALNGTVNNKSSYKDYGYFGILGAEFDENGCASGNYKCKKSYTTMQTIASIFSGEFNITTLPIVYLPEMSPGIYEQDLKSNEVVSYSFGRADGSSIYVYWKPGNTMTTEYSGTITLQCSMLDRDIKLIDLIDGTVYEIDDSAKEEENNGCVTLKHLPVTDYPMALMFGKFADKIKQI